MTSVSGGLEVIWHHVRKHDADLGLRDETMEIRMAGMSGRWWGRWRDRDGDRDGDGNGEGEGEGERDGLEGHREVMGTRDYLGYT